MKDVEKHTRKNKTKEILYIVQNDRKINELTAVRGWVRVIIVG